MRERLALTAWFDVVGIALVLATVVYSPVLYAWTHDVDVWRGWVIDVVVVTLPLVFLGAWLLAEHFGNVADDLVARRRRAEHAARAAELDRATAWCTPDVFAAALDRAISALPADYVRELETRNVGITTDDIDAEWPYALGLYRRFPTGRRSSSFASRSRCMRARPRISTRRWPTRCCTRSATPSA